MPGDVILALVGYTDERRHGLFTRSDIDGHALSIPRESCCADDAA
jgi:hypothetical protein